MKLRILANVQKRIEAAGPTIKTRSVKNDSVLIYEPTVYTFKPTKKFGLTKDEYFEFVSSDGYGLPLGTFYIMEDHPNVEGILLSHTNVGPNSVFRIEAHWFDDKKYAIKFLKYLLVNLTK